MNTKSTDPSPTQDPVRDPAQEARFQRLYEGHVARAKQRLDDEAAGRIELTNDEAFSALRLTAPTDEIDFLESLSTNSVGQDKSLWSVLPFVGTAGEGMDIAYLIGASDRYEAGNATREDVERIAKFLHYGQRQMSAGGIAGAMGSELIPFMLETLTVGGIAGRGVVGLGKAAVKAKIAKMLSGVASMGIAKGAIRLGKGVAAAPLVKKVVATRAAQAFGAVGKGFGKPLATAVPFGVEQTVGKELIGSIVSRFVDPGDGPGWLGSRVMNATHLDYLKDKYDYQPSAYGLDIVANDNVELLSRMPRALFEEFIQNWSEGTGRSLGEGLAALNKSLNIKFVDDLIRKTAKKMPRGAKGGAAKAVFDRMKQTGYDGIIEEAFEEVVGSEAMQLAGEITGDEEWLQSRENFWEPTQLQGMAMGLVMGAGVTRGIVSTGQRGLMALQPTDTKALGDMRRLLVSARQRAESAALGDEEGAPKRQMHLEEKDATEIRNLYQAEEELRIKREEGLYDEEGPPDPEKAIEIMRAKYRELEEATDTRLADMGTMDKEGQLAELERMRAKSKNVQAQIEGEAVEAPTQEPVAGETPIEQEVSGPQVPAVEEDVKTAEKAIEVVEQQDESVADTETDEKGNRRLTPEGEASTRAQYEGHQATRDKWEAVKERSRVAAEEARARGEEPGPEITGEVVPWDELTDHQKIIANIHTRNNEGVLFVKGLGHPALQYGETSVFDQELSKRVHVNTVGLDGKPIKKAVSPEQAVDAHFLHETFHNLVRKYGKKYLDAFEALINNALPGLLEINAAEYMRAAKAQGMELTEEELAEEAVSRSLEGLVHFFGAAAKANDIHFFRRLLGNQERRGVMRTIYEVLRGAASALPFVPEQRVKSLEPLRDAVENLANLSDEQFLASVALTEELMEAWRGAGEELEGGRATLLGWKQAQASVVPDEPRGEEGVEKPPVAPKKKKAKKKVAKKKAKKKATKKKASKKRGKKGGVRRNLGDVSDVGAIAEYADDVIAEGRDIEDMPSIIRDGAEELGITEEELSEAIDAARARAEAGEEPVPVKPKGFRLIDRATGSAADMVASGRTDQTARVAASLGITEGAMGLSVRVAQHSASTIAREGELSDNELDEFMQRGADEFGVSTEYMLLAHIAASTAAHEANDARAHIDQDAANSRSEREAAEYDPDTGEVMWNLGENIEAMPLDELTDGSIAADLSENLVEAMRLRAINDRGGGKITVSPALLGDALDAMADKVEGWIRSANIAAPELEQASTPLERLRAIGKIAEGAGGIAKPSEAPVTAYTYTQLLGDPFSIKRFKEAMEADRTIRHYDSDGNPTTPQGFAEVQAQEFIMEMVMEASKTRAGSGWSAIGALVEALREAIKIEIDTPGSGSPNARAIATAAAAAQDLVHQSVPATFLDRAAASDISRDEAELNLRRWGAEIPIMREEAAWNEEGPYLIGLHMSPNRFSNFGSENQVKDYHFVAHDPNYMDGMQEYTNRHRLTDEHVDPFGAVHGEGQFVHAVVVRSNRTYDQERRQDIIDFKSELLDLTGTDKLTLAATLLLGRDAVIEALQGEASGQSIIGGVEMARQLREAASELRAHLENAGVKEIPFEAPTRKDFRSAGITESVPVANIIKLILDVQLDPAKVMFDNPFGDNDLYDPHPDADIDEVVIEAVTSWGNYAAGGELGKGAGFSESISWPSMELPHSIQALKNAGFDAMYVRETNYKNLAIFDGNNIKAVTNTGAFGEGLDISRNLGDIIDLGPTPSVSPLGVAHAQPQAVALSQPVRARTDDDPADASTVIHAVQGAVIDSSGEPSVFAANMERGENGRHVFRVQVLDHEAPGAVGNIVHHALLNGASTIVTGSEEAAAAIAAHLGRQRKVRGAIPTSEVTEVEDGYAVRLTPAHYRAEGNLYAYGASKVKRDALEAVTGRSSWQDDDIRFNLEGESLPTPTSENGEQLPDLEAYDAMLNQYLKRLDRSYHAVGARLKILENRIKDAAPDSVNRRSAKELGGWVKRMGRAIHLRIDMQEALIEDPSMTIEALVGHWRTAAKNGGNAYSTEQEETIADALALEGDMLSVMEDLARENHLMGQALKRAKLIDNAREYYSARIWFSSEHEIDSNSFVDMMGSAPISPTQAGGVFRLGVGDRTKARVFGSILEGWSHGKKLSVDDALVAAERVHRDGFEAMHNIAVRKALVDAGLVRLRKGDEKLPEGFVKIKTTAHAFRDYYAVAPVALHIKRLTSRIDWANMDGGKFLHWIYKAQATTKATLLFTSLFHHQAFMRSFFYSIPNQDIKSASADILKIAKASGMSLWNPEAATQMLMQSRHARSGMDAALNMTPELMDGVEAGLTIGLGLDYSTVVNWNNDWRNTWVEQFVGLGSKAAARRLADKRVQSTNWLFGVLGASLKSQAFLLEYRHQLHANANALAEGSITKGEIAERVASKTNDDFGGLNLRREGQVLFGARGAGSQLLMRLIFLAPDWTESNFNTAFKLIKSTHGTGKLAIGGPDTRERELQEFRGKLARRVAAGEIDQTEADSILERRKKAPRRLEQRIYGGLYLQAAMRSQLPTLIWNAIMAGLDDEETLQSIYGKAWESNWLNALKMDVTPISRMLDGVFGGRLQRQEVHHADSRVYYSALGHFLDPIKWLLSYKYDMAGPLKAKLAPGGRLLLNAVTGTDWKGMAYTDLGPWSDREKTLLEGHMKEWKFGARGVGASQATSFLFSNVLDNLPIALSSLREVIFGEQTVFDFIAHASGAHTTRIGRSGLSSSWASGAEGGGK